MICDSIIGTTLFYLELDNVNLAYALSNYIAAALR